MSRLYWTASFKLQCSLNQHHSSLQPRPSQLLSVVPQHWGRFSIQVALVASDMVSRRLISVLLLTVETFSFKFQRLNSLFKITHYSPSTNAAQGHHGGFYG